VAFTTGIALEPGNLIFHEGDAAIVLDRLLSLWRIVRKADGAIGLVYPDFFVGSLIIMSGITLTQLFFRNLG
jgi:hypothetical protein